MEVHQLRYFCAIVEAGSFTRAAEQSHVSQPSLSQQIRKLEDELGERLFDRLGRRVRLTEIGRAFLPRARAVLNEMEMARSEIVERKTSVMGRVVAGVIPTITPYFLPPVLAAFTCKYPQAPVSIIEEITAVLLERLRAGTVDVAIVALPLDVRGHEFESFPLLVEKLYAVLPKQHRLAKRDTLALGELDDESFLLLRDGHCFRATAIEACNRARIHPRIVFESGQFSSILSMVNQGLGVSIVPAMAVERHPARCYVPIADKRAVRTIGAISLRGRSRTRVVEAFLATLHAHGAAGIAAARVS